MISRFYDMIPLGYLSYPKDCAGGDFALDIRFSWNRAVHRSSINICSKTPRNAISVVIPRHGSSQQHLTCDSNSSAHTHSIYFAPHGRRCISSCSISKYLASRDGQSRARRLAEAATDRTSRFCGESYCCLDCDIVRCRDCDSTRARASAQERCAFGIVCLATGPGRRARSRVRIGSRDCFEREIGIRDVADGLRCCCRSSGCCPSAYDDHTASAGRKAGSRRGGRRSRARCCKVRSAEGARTHGIAQTACCMADRVNGALSVRWAAEARRVGALVVARCAGLAGSLEELDWR
jgi:hypothetical protein